MCLLSSAHICDDTLAQICDSDNGPVSWSLCGEPVSVNWVHQDKGTGSAGRATSANGLAMVYNKSKSAVGIYYPEEMGSFFSEHSLMVAFMPEGFLGRKLSPEVEQICFWSCRKSDQHWA